MSDVRQRKLFHWGLAACRNKNGPHIFRRRKKRNEGRVLHEVVCPEGIPCRQMQRCGATPDHFDARSSIFGRFLFHRIIRTIRIVSRLKMNYGPPQFDGVWGTLTGKKYVSLRRPMSRGRLPGGPAGSGERISPPGPACAEARDDSERFRNLLRYSGSKLCRQIPVHHLFSGTKSTVFERATPYSRTLTDRYYHLICPHVSSLFWDA